MNVFEAFPNAILTNVWQIGQVKKATETGDIYTPYGYVDVIIDEVASGALDKSPDADGLDVDTLIYARPEQLPGLNISRFISVYYFRDTSTGQYYEIRRVGVGKNQQTGRVEHIEFELRAKEVVNSDE